MVALERPTPWETWTSDQSCPARSARNARTCSRVWLPRPCPPPPLPPVARRPERAAVGEPSAGTAVEWPGAAGLAVAGRAWRCWLASQSARAAVAIAAPETSSASPSLTLAKIVILLPFPWSGCFTPLVLAGWRPHAQAVSPGKPLFFLPWLPVAGVPGGRGGAQGAPGATQTATRLPRPAASTPARHHGRLAPR